MKVGPTEDAKTRIRAIAESTRTQIDEMLADHPNNHIIHEPVAKQAIADFLIRELKKPE